MRIEWFPRFPGAGDSVRQRHATCKPAPPAASLSTGNGSPCFRLARAAGILGFPEDSPWRPCLGRNPSHYQAPRQFHMPDRLDPLVRHARREAWFTAAVCVAAMAYTVSYCRWFGFNRAAADVHWVLGVPDWVFFGIVLPWLVCLAITAGFAFGVMHDDSISAAGDPDDDVLDDELQGTPRGGDNVS